MAGKSDTKSGKGIPRKARSLSRKSRRSKNLASQPLKKLRNLLKRNGIRAAFEWANEHTALAALRQLRPNYTSELAGTKKDQPEG